MPKNILIDLNVIIDVLLERRGFEASRDVIQLGEAGRHQPYISAHMVTTFAYILEAARVPRSQILRHIGWLLQLFVVVPVDSALLGAALKSRIKDYEDAVVEQVARECEALLIVTRNVKDFKPGAVRAVTPEQYLRMSLNPV